jgi:hypothetical protein
MFSENLTQCSLGNPEPINPEPANPKPANPNSLEVWKTLCCVYPCISHFNYYHSMLLLLLLLYTLRYNIFALRSFSLTLGDDILYLTYSIEFRHFGTICPVIPSYSPDDQGATAERNS